MPDRYFRLPDDWFGRRTRPMPGKPRMDGADHSAVGPSPAGC